MTFCTIFYIITLAAHERRKKFPDSSMVEHSTVNRVVVSSSLTRGAKWPDGQAVKTPPFHGGIGGSIPPPVTTSFGRLAQLGERLPYKQNVSSSILLAPTIFFLPFFAYNQVGLFVRRGVAQFGRAPALGAGGRRFKSCRSDQFSLCGCSSMVEP